MKHISRKVRKSIIACLSAFVATSAIASDMGSKTPLKAMTWEPYAGTPMMVAKLWGDRAVGAYGMYLKVPAGFTAGRHAHSAAYHGVNIQGTWIHTMDGRTLTLQVGGHVYQPGGQYHDDTCKGPQECIWMIVQDAKGDFIPGSH